MNSGGRIESGGKRPFFETYFNVLSLGVQPAHRFEIGFQSKPNPETPRMLGLLKLICPTLVINQPISFGCTKIAASMVVATIVACFAEFATAQGQRAVYPYPTTQSTYAINGNTRGLLTGFPQQGQGLAGQTQFGQSVLTQSLVDPSLAAPVPQQGPVGQSAFGAQPAPQPQGFPIQPSLGAQPSLVELLSLIHI